MQSFLVSSIENPRVIFDDVQDIKKILLHNFTLYEKRCFRGALSNKKLAGISLLNAKETILKKKNVSLTIHSCLGKYSYNLDTF